MSTESSEPNKRKELCYRVQNAAGAGMYSMLNPARDLMQDRRMHPAPGRDEKLAAFYYDKVYWCSPYLFGFSSMEQLRRWLYDPEVRRVTAEAGFSISIYECDDYCIGDTQMVFNKNTAKLIGSFDLV